MSSPGGLPLLNESSDQLAPSTPVTSPAVISNETSTVSEQLLAFFVGPDEVRFDLNYMKLTDLSDWFPKNLAIQEGFNLHLPKEDPETFAAFATWVLQDLDRGALPQLPDPDPRTCGDEDTLKLVKLWVMAERLEMDGLMNQVMDAIRAYHQEYQDLDIPFKLDLESLQYVMDHAMYTSKMRDYFCAMLASLTDRGLFWSDHGERTRFRELLVMHPDVAVEIVDCFRGDVRDVRAGDDGRQVRNPAIWPDHEDLCWWHVHHNSPRCFPMNHPLTNGHG